jgi:RHS repeat-associated protein
MTAGYLATGERFIATYDINSRLTSITFTRNSVNVVESFEYFYSGMLARNKLTENGQITKDIKYLRLGLTELQERNATDTVTATNWWHPNAPGGVGGLLRRNESGSQNSTDYYPNYDHNGNIVQVTNQQGQVIENLFYATFGKTLQGDNPLPFGFSTKRNDFASGLIYYGQRFYLPHLGRWLNRDPIGEQDDLNLYAMVAGDPVNKIDPNGEFAWGLALGLGNFAYQMYRNRGNIRCVKWGDVAMWGLGGIGGKLGWVAGGKYLKGSGMNFSHFIPTRMGKSTLFNNKFGKRLLKTGNKWNGRYVSRQRHYKHDSSYYGNAGGSPHNFGLPAVCTNLIYSFNAQ